ncbi:amidohydrolase family protein [Henriciella sp.]|uniref:amidohydrolase family protein n=1 Tax=Henriciella sp. TaxID=1968823 RepID=UPI00262218A5|nr:amidohydrolase family protein [Henriciella sp.]
MIRSLLSCTAFSALLLTGCQTTHYTETATLYHGFSRVDPVNEEVIEDAWLVVDGDTIAATGSGDLPEFDFAQSHDMAGLYALPGMIDAHAHITSGPHSTEFVDGAPLVTIESRDDITRFNAKMALAFGITTVRNPGGSTEANQAYDQNIVSGAWIGPEALHAGSVIQPPPMGGAAFAYPQSDAEWDAEAQRQADAGMDYFKLYVSLTEDELAKGIAAAERVGLKPIAHLHMVSWTTAAELGVHGLEHALPTSPDLLEPEAREAYVSGFGPNSKFMYQWFELADYDGPLFQELVDTLVENQTVLNFNFIVNHLVYNADDPQLIPDEWAPYIHPEILTGFREFTAASVYGWTEEDFKRARAVFPRVLEFGKRLYDAGLPVMIGTDASGGLPYYAMEAGFYVDAGIPVWDVLRMATSSTADQLGIGGRTGRIEPGLEADIVFLKANPVDRIDALGEVDTVLNNGTAYTFDDLTSQSPLTPETE